MENSNTRNSQEVNKQQAISESKFELQKRFEELDKWQDERKKALDERQVTKLRMLNMEQHKIYEMMGLLEANESHINENTEQKSSAKHKSRTYLKRGEGIKRRYKIDPEILRLTNLPRYKYAKKRTVVSPNKLTLQKGNTSKTSAPIIKPLVAPNNKLKTSTKALDVQEQHFQHLLFTGQNVYNSTPEMKLITLCNSKQINENEIAAKKPLSWAEVLDPTNIKPISVQEIRGGDGDSSVSDYDNLSMFELLEEKANEGEVNLFANTIQVLIKRKQQERLAELPDPNDIPVSEELLSSTLKPTPDQIFIEETSTEQEEEDDETEQENNNDDDNDEDDEEDEEFKKFQNEETETTEVKDSELKTHHVHFAQNADGIESQTAASDDSGSETDDTLTATDEESIDDDELDAEKTNENEETNDLTAAMDEKSIFEHFKQALFSVLQANADALEKDNKINDSKENTPSTVQPLCTNLSSLTTFDDQMKLKEDLEEKSKLVKERLAELEKEISIFKEKNTEILNARNELELEKVEFAQEVTEAKEKLNDERMKFEIYMHDERMKLDKEKQQTEQQLRMQKNSAKSQTRKEITELKQQIEDLQQQLKQKEQQHTSAQARLRAQIRNYEKDQKQLQEEIDTLIKEQKKLQAEIVRITRDQNNKMLQEINRNIAKLTPKVDSLVNSNLITNNVAKCHRSPEKKSTKKTRTRLSEMPLTSIATTSTSTSTNDAINSSMEFENEIDNIEKSPQKENKNEVEKYHKGKNAQLDGEFKREIFNPDGSKDILYPNGNLKKISAEGRNIRMLYFNKDIKETNINEGMVKYYYASTNVWHTTYLDGLEILEFPNGQTEHRHKNGRVEVHFPNNSIKIINPKDDDKLEEWRFADGTHLVHKRNGDKILTLPNGQKEVHTKLNKRREYPDGTVKLVYPDGSQETRYSNGRVRLKDKDGNLLRDTAA